jgi:hypothetical protein
MEAYPRRRGIPARLYPFPSSITSLQGNAGVLGHLDSYRGTL